MLFKFFSLLMGCLVCSVSLISSAAFADQQTDFSWLPNKESNIAGYKIYYGPKSRSYLVSVDVGNPSPADGVVQAAVGGLADGTTYYFAATAYDTDGLESDYSQEVIWTSPVDEPITLPSPPIANDLHISISEDITGTGQLNGQSSNGLPLIFQIVKNGSKGTASILDSRVGTFSYTPQTNFNGVDTFSYKVSDANGESNEATVTVNVTRQQATPSFSMEIGELTVDGKWSYIPFTETFQDPVVVAKPASSNDPSPCVVRIRNLTPAGFEIRLQSFDYLLDEHGMENIGYIAVERGSFVLENGKRVEAGLFTTNAVGYPESIAFAEPFSITPVVATSIITENEYDAVVSRIDNVTSNSFDFQLQEQEANTTSHAYENIAYIAWEPFSGVMGEYAFEIELYGDVDDQWLPVSFSEGFDKAPVLIAGIQTYNGSDTANLRHNGLQANGVQLRITEEQSADSETTHVFETLGFMAISPANAASNPDVVVEEPTVPAISLDANAYIIKRRKIVELFWSGANGTSVQIRRTNESNEPTTTTVENEGYYKDKLRKGGLYTYQVCETVNSVCSDAVNIEL